MLHRLESKVVEFIRRHELFAGAEGILLAVSGGADSIALLHVLMLLRAKGFMDARLVCAHINHGLRGLASDEDERFVAEQAAGLGLPVATRAVEVRAHADRQRLSLETAARQLRLAGLTEMAREQGCTWVAAGHQKNDNAETVIHRLYRGTGWRGLAGIRARRPLGAGLWLGRPLLCAARTEIIRYLAEHKLPWREDHTNADLAYTRNVIRHRWLPALQGEAQHCLVEELADLAASAGKLYDRIQREAEEAKSRLVRPRGTEAAIDTSGLSSLPEMVVMELVRQVLVDLGCGERALAQPHYRGLLRLARQRAPSTSISLPEGFTARKEQSQMVVGARVPATVSRAGLTSLESPPPTTIPIPGEVRYANCEISARILDRHGAEIAQSRGRNGCFGEYFDLDRLQQPLMVRRRRAGDRFQPLGLAAEKKVGKFLTTAKVPREQREHVLILADREKIIWVWPVRMGERAKVTQATQRILALTVSPRPAPRREGSHRQNSQTPPMQPPA